MRVSPTADSAPSPAVDPPAPGRSMPDELDPRHLRKGLIQLTVIGAIVVALVVFGPGLDSLRARLRDASASWLIAAAACELLSTLSYVLVFRSVFCARMSWRLSYQIGMAEQGANSLLPAGGAGGLALGAWALNRGGLDAEHIGRRSVAFFLLTSLANVGTLAVVATLFAVGALGGDTDTALTDGFGLAAVAAIVITLSVPKLGARLLPRNDLPADAGRARHAVRHVRNAIGDGVRDSIVLLGTRTAGVLSGSLGYMAFDIAVMYACFEAFGSAPPVAIVILAYIIGQLGGLIPVPGGIGGTEGGLIGTFALYHVGLAEATVAVLAYRALALWIPAVLGSVAFLRLRTSLARLPEPAQICEPLAEPMPAARRARRRRRRAAA